MNGFRGGPVPGIIIPGMMSRRDLVKYSAALGMAVPVSRALMSPASVGAEGNVVSVGVTSTPTTMDISKPDWSTWWGINYLYDTLLSTDDNENFVPLLAESYEASADGLTYTLKLRQGVKFHDGTDFNADAVKFNYDRILTDPDNGWNASFSTDIDNVEVVDEYTVVFHLKVLDVFFPFVVLADWGSIQVSPTAVQKEGVDFGKNPVGTGPFVFKSFEADAQVEFTANPNYWGGAPTIEGVLTRIIPESSTRNIELEAETLDIGMGIEIQDAQELEGANVVIEKRYGPAAHMVTMNVSTGPTADLAVRKAIALGMDRDTMINDVLFGIPEKSWSGVAKVSPYYSEDVPTIAYDAEAAKKTLEDAGYTAGSDGMRSKDGTPLKVTILSADYTNWNQFNQIVQEQLKAVGIDSDLQTLEWGAYLDKWRDTDEWHVSFHNQGGGFHTTNIAYASVDPEAYWSINHIIRSKDPETMKISDQLISIYKQFNQELDPEKRRALSIQFQTIYQDNQLTCWLWHQPWLFAINNRVQNYSIQYNAVLLNKATVS